MRLPDSFLDELRNRLPLSQVVGRKVMWDMKKTNQAKGDWWAPCPFHQEKTASFHVDDRKGFFYCFGCQAKGNLFRFVQDTENVGFMEAVEILAGEAGMTMPARDLQAAQRSDRRKQLSDLCEDAVRWFRLQLSRNGGAGARDYLRGRGLTPETAKRFEIGFAPTERDGLRRHLIDKGAAPDLIEAAGLATPAADGDVRDRFINRLIFPIRDGRGRAIGFGGRAMNPNAKAKYLNSPETELFDKGANLYNLGPAREAAGKGRPLLVAEGYMDVIALAQAGFEAAVAPLGTAITERQLRLLWQVSPEPLIALDGDAAGRRAGLRVADLALPAMEAGQALRFVLLPEGQDPDDLIRDAGADAFTALIDRAVPMATLLWERVTANRVLDAPERRAAFDRDLRALIKQVADPALRRAYADDFARRRQELLGPQPRREVSGSDRPWPGKGRPWQPRGPLPPSPTARASAMATGQSPDAMMEQVILATLVLRPALIPSLRDTLDGHPWSRPDHATLAAAVLAAPDTADSAALRKNLSDRGDTPSLEPMLSLPHVRITPAGRPGTDDAAAAECIEDMLNRLDARRGADRERREALEDYDLGGDETLTWRLAEANRRRDAVARAARDEGGDEDADEAERSAHLQRLLDTRVWEKSKTR
ncbi:DNA primase [Jannaschia sp. LMIT008]|uniref:DNA primase n=1 Tax=Jannaschia maritima TaxID=3032585 RepID=UPI002811019A|nr:DNA primase [Jannaschia sp. LMIT008]